MRAVRWTWPSYLYLVRHSSLPNRALVRFVTEGPFAGDASEFPMSRAFLAAAALSLLAYPAAAGGAGCAGGDCYVQTYVAPSFGIRVERTLVRAPRTYALVTEPAYRTVHERVLVQPPGRVWTVTRDEFGREVGCWVETPARYGTVSRQVMVRAPEVVPYAQTTAWGYQSYPVLVEPGHRAWTPVGRH